MTFAFAFAPMPEDPIARRLSFAHVRVRASPKDAPSSAAPMTSENSGVDATVGNGLKTSNSTKSVTSSNASVSRATTTVREGTGEVTESGSISDAEGRAVSPIKSARQSASWTTPGTPEPRPGVDEPDASFHFDEVGEGFDTDGEDTMSFDSANFSMAVNMTMDTENETFHSVSARSRSLDAFYDDEISSTSARGKKAVWAIGKSIFGFAVGFGVVTLIAVEIASRVESSASGKPNRRSLGTILRKKTHADADTSSDVDTKTKMTQTLNH